MERSAEGAENKTGDLKIHPIEWFGTVNPEREMEISRPEIFNVLNPTASGVCLRHWWMVMKRPVVALEGLPS